MTPAGDCEDVAEGRDEAEAAGDRMTLAVGWMLGDMGVKDAAALAVALAAGVMPVVFTQEAVGAMETVSVAEGTEDGKVGAMETVSVAVGTLDGKVGAMDELCVRVAVVERLAEAQELAVPEPAAVGEPETEAVEELCASAQSMSSNAARADLPMGVTHGFQLVPGARWHPSTVAPPNLRTTLARETATLPSAAAPAPRQPFFVLASHACAMASLGENLQPQVLMAIARQIRQLVKEPPSGVRYVPGEQVTEILAEVDGPQGTPFEGGTFLVRLVLGSDYPAAPPKGALGAPEPWACASPLAAPLTPTPLCTPFSPACRVHAHQDFPPQCVPHGRDLRQHAEKGLEAREHAGARAAGH